MNALQLRRDIIRPALKTIGYWSQNAENLVAGTAAQESRLEYVRQLGNGPALGLWQCEPKTHADIWSNFLRYRKHLAVKVWAAAGVDEQFPFCPPHDWLIFNLRYAAAICRVHYLRAPGGMPRSVAGMGALWKSAYNTKRGKGEAEEFVKNYELVRTTEE